MKMELDKQSSKTSTLLTLLLIILFSALSQLNIILKYGGKYWDGDALLMSHYTSQLLEFGYDIGGYGSGINYQILAINLSQICQFDLIQLYLYVIPIINSLLLIIIVYVVMRGLTGNGKIALWATFLILLQPDFLIMLHRAKHDIYSFIFGILILTYFIKYQKSVSFRLKFAYFLILMIFTFSFSFYSLPFFSLFTFSLLIYFIVNLFNMKYDSPYMKSLLFFIVISLIFISDFNSHIYPPYGGIYNYIGHFIESITLLFTEDLMQSADGYSSYIGDAYDSPFKFLFLFLFNIFLSIVTFYSFKKYRKIIKPETKLILVSFAFLTILMLISDKYGFAGNMGLRAFYFTTFPAIAISSIGIYSYMNSNEFTVKKILMLIFVICILFYSSNVKTTADSDWVNIPYHYVDAEVSVLKFTENHVLRLEDSNPYLIFTDHRLKYVGAAYMSPNIWRREKFRTDTFVFNNASVRGLYINSDIYTTRGFRGSTGLVKIENRTIMNLEKNQKIYGNGFTEAYLND